MTQVIERQYSIGHAPGENRQIAPRMALFGIYLGGHLPRALTHSGLMVRAAQAVYGIDQYFDLIRIDVLVNAVTEVEYVAAALTK